MKKKILLLIGTRPNFIKVTQFKNLVQKFPIFDLRIVHTGQHFDSNMADVFFQQFNLTPDYFLNISPVSANSQMAEIMLRLEKLINEEFKADLIMVVGDVNSTLAGAITANKLGIKLAHIESGLRSRDTSMPEEINRILTDEITDYFFVTEQSGYDNLLIEGKSKENIFFVGNTMIDTIVAFSNQINASTIMGKLDLSTGKFVLVTMHRPATVDSPEGLRKLIKLLELVTAKYKIVFPMHPRTLKKIEECGFWDTIHSNSNLILTDPLDYFAFQKLIKNCRFILTDSGGIQEESTFLHVPCLTFRPNTERPSTINLGTNELIPFDLNVVKQKIEAIENGSFKGGGIPPLWDGQSTARILDVLNEKFYSENLE